MFKFKADFVSKLSGFQEFQLKELNAKFLEIKL